MNEAIAANTKHNHRRRNLLRDLRKLREYESYWQNEYYKFFNEYRDSPNAMNDHQLIDFIFCNRRELYEVEEQISLIQNQLNPYE